MDNSPTIPSGEDETTAQVLPEEGRTVEGSGHATDGARGVVGGAAKERGRGEGSEPKSAKKVQRVAQKREQGFPKGCVKRIMKLGEDTRNVSGEALLLITKASELFLERFAKETFRHAHEEGRRAIKYQDVSDVRVADPNLIFLEAVVPP